MTPNSLAEYYHEQTKYTPEGLQRAGRRLDFDHQPVPFKEYVYGREFDLTPYLPTGDELKSDQDLAAWRLSLTADARALAEISHLLYLTNGVTAVVPYAEQPLLLRAAPSAGGLYPTEIYLAVRGHAALPDGLYNYQVRDHSLVQFWRQDVWPQLEAACFGHPALAATDMVVILSGVYERSAWRYEDRAYRRIMLDTGHVLGNLTMVAPCIDRHALPIGGFKDDVLNEALFLEREEEGAIALIPLLPTGAALEGPTAIAGPVHASRDVPQGDRLAALHEAGKIENAPVVMPKGGPQLPGGDKYAASTDGAPGLAALLRGEPLAAEALPWEGQLGPTIMSRRSTRGYTGEGLTRDELAMVLDFAYRPDMAPAGLCHEAHPRYFTPQLLETYVAVHDVEGLDPGCYHYDPARRELRQVRFTALRKEVRHLALGQDLAGKAGAVVFHTADLPQAVERFGDRVYRYLHLDAGHLGQRMNLAAIRLGLGVSGIAGFFDDQVNDMLGIPEREAVLYLTTLGRPIGDE